MLCVGNSSSRASLTLCYKSWISVAGRTYWIGQETVCRQRSFDSLNLTAQIYTDLLSFSVVKGRKTENEKVRRWRTTVEAFISASGRVIQGASATFGKETLRNCLKLFMRSLKRNKNHTSKNLNSWGISTRTMGVMTGFQAKQ